MSELAPDGLDTSPRLASYAAMARAAFSTALILGIDGHVGAYLARLVHARGTTVLGVADPAPAGPDALAGLGIAGDINLVTAYAGLRLAGAGEAEAIFAIAGGGLQAELVAATLVAAAPDRGEK